MSKQVGVIYPNEINGLYGWWDATDLSTLVNGTDVNSWPDKSGNGFHLVWENYNNVSVKSKKQTGSNGNAIINGNGIYKTSSMLLGASQPITFFMVYKSNQLNGNTIFGTPQDATAFGLISSTNLNVFFGSANSVIATPADLAYHQFTTIVSTTASQRLVRFDQNNKSIIANNNAGITNLWLNSRPVGYGGNGSNAHCEIVIYNRALSLQEIQRVERYLKFKWGL